MNALGLLFVWTAAQVTLFCAVGIGLYALARRRNPAAGAWAVGAVLGGVVAISALAFSPWPQVWMLALGTTEPDQIAAAGAIDEANNATTAPFRPLDVAPAVGAADGPGDRDEGTRAAAAQQHEHFRRRLPANLRESVSLPVDPRASNAWGWPAWVAAALMAGAVLGVIRLLMALVAVARFRRHSERVDDCELLELLDEVRGRLRCGRGVALREIALNCSPSTIGWLRPAIVLPGNWRGWSHAQQRAILAHEVAHIARGDFAVWLMAQLSAALHFYNPLVHWLSGRLRLEQEMAADVCGAQVAGGRQLYLTVLAEMALRQNQPPTWAARPFLPTRGTLMRRIEILHQQKLLPDMSFSGSRRAVLAVVMLALGALIAGVRGPATGAPPDESKNAARAGLAPFNLDYVTDDTQMLLVLRPAELSRLKSLAALKEALGMFGVFEPLGVPLDDVEEFRVVMNGKFPPVNNDPENQPWSVMMVRSKQPRDWSSLGKYFIGESEEATENGQTYFRSRQVTPAMNSAYWLPDNRTIVITSAAAVTRTFTLRGLDKHPAWTARWGDVARSPAAALVRTSTLQPMLAAFNAEPGQPAPNLAEVADVVLFKGAETEGAFHVDGMIECRSAAAAGEVHALIRRGLDTIRNQFVALRQAPPDAQFQASGMLHIVAMLIDATRLETAGDTVRSRTSITNDFGQEFAKAVTPARAAARRAVSANKMKQIGIALLNYHDTYKHFPAASIIGPDGKTPHSWRVDLLPFLEKNDLYQRYKMDEPWDSEHNRSLIKEAAELFSVPGDKPDDDCSYFLVTGPGTVFDATQPPTQIRSIVDGTSLTIGLVEAKRAIRWTKPDDVEIDPDKPLPKLGGYFDDGFHVGFMDGSVQFIPKGFDEALFKKFVTKAGREPIQRDQLNAVRAQAPVQPPPAPETTKSVASAGAAARRAMSANKMKQIGIAMLNYYDRYNHFPAASIIGPDGKTPHSWRVELLPFLELEKNDLYQRYRMDEPWDSEHNRALIKEAADVFSVPEDKPDGNCGYFLLTGPGTAFDGSQPPSAIRTIRDGTSNTVGLVEARRAIPWTKLEDVGIDPDKPLPKLGGFFDDGFNVGFMDGSIHFFPSKVGEELFKALATKSGGEVIQRDPQTGLFSLPK